MARKSILVVQTDVSSNVVQSLIQYHCTTNENDEHQQRLIFRQLPCISS
jgi:hypothetical protein